VVTYNTSVINFQNVLVSCLHVCSRLQYCQTFNKLFDNI
jgi:hypothetical protein